MNLKQHWKLSVLLVVATLGTTGCTDKQIEFSNGTTIPMSELTREVTWMEDADLLMLQIYAQSHAASTVCNDLNEIERRGLKYFQEEMKAQRDLWLFPKITETAKQDWKLALQVLTTHYVKTADEDFCEEFTEPLTSIATVRERKREQ